MGVFPNQVCLPGAQTARSQDTKTLRLAAEEGVAHEAGKSKIHLPKVRGLGYLWTKAKAWLV